MKNPYQNKYDVIIVGGGPGGYTSALYCARSALKTLVVEELIPGGQMSTTEYVENYPGFDSGIEGFALGQKMQKGAEKAGATTLYAHVESMDLARQDKIIYTSKGDYVASAVILAMGASPRRLGVPGEEQLLGKGVSYCATCDGAFFRDKTVAVVGGGNSALGEALTLSGLCQKVFLIHHKGDFTASKVSVDSCLAQPNIIVLYHTEVLRLIEQNGRLGAIEIADRTTGNTSALQCQGLFVAIGRVPNTAICMAYINTDERGYILADETTKTNVEGVFAIGDLRAKPLRQIITAASDGAVAAMYADQYVRQNQPRISPVVDTVTTSSGRDLPLP